MIHLLAEPIQDPLIQWLAGAGVTGILSLLVVAFMRDWIVSGPAYMRVIEERNKALDINSKNAEVAQRAVDLVLARMELEAELRRTTRLRENHDAG